MIYDDLNNLYKNNAFREIDKESNSRKFYLLRSISKANTLTKFCEQYNTEKNLNNILNDKDITENMIIDFIKSELILKSPEEIKNIEAELNKMQSFDWGGSRGNNLEKNIVNNYVKKILKYEEIEEAIAGTIQKSVYGYTLNSWYNHWSTVLIENIFNNNKRILPTVDLVEKIDFFIDSIPFDLKVTYFPDELMKSSISEKLKEKYGSKSELTCEKNIARELNITIPSDLNDKALTVCLNNLLNESVEEKAKLFIKAKKIIALIITIVVIAGGVCGWLFLSKNSKSNNGDSNNKIAVIYFSTTGTTEKVAGYIKDATGGDLIEIVPKDKYTDSDLNYNNSNSRSTKEQNDSSARPEISNNIDTDSYDVIYLGYPIWWKTGIYVRQTEKVA